MAPSQPQQIIAQGVGQKPLSPVGIDAQVAVALRQFGTVLSMDQGDMGEGGQGPTEDPEQLGLAEGVGQVVVAADDMGHPHVVVVDDHRQHIGRRAVGAQQDHVVQLVVGHRHRALDQVFDHGFTVGGHLQADGRLGALGGFGRVAVPPAAIIELRAAFLAGGLAHFPEFLGRAETLVSLVFGQQLTRHLGVTLGVEKLRNRVAVPIQPQPLKTVINGIDGLFGGTLAVRILDAQQKSAAGTVFGMVLGEQPVIQCGTRTSDMKKTTGRGCETGNDGHVDRIGVLLKDQGVTTGENYHISWAVAAYP